MNILFLGAHTDDIEIGAGATLAKVVNNNNVKCITFSKCLDLERNKKIADDQERVVAYLSKSGVDYTMHDFTNRDLRSDSFEIRSELEKQRAGFKPDIIFTHWSQDLNQDHAYISEETVRVFRAHSIIMYPIPNSCYGFQANFFIPVERRAFEEKMKLLAMYKSQKELLAMDQSLHRSLMMSSKMACGSEMAEAFYAYKCIISI